MGPNSLLVILILGTTYVSRNEPKMVLLFLFLLVKGKEY